MQISCQRVVGSQVETRTRMQPCESMYRPSATSFCTSASSVCSCAKSGRSSGAMLRHALSVRVYVSGAAGGKLGKLGCVTKSPQDTCCILGRWPGAICLHAQVTSFRTLPFPVCLGKEKQSLPSFSDWYSYDPTKEGLPHARARPQLSSQTAIDHRDSTALHNSFWYNEQASAHDLTRHLCHRLFGDQ